MSKHIVWAIATVLCGFAALYVNVAHNNLMLTIIFVVLAFACALLGSKELKNRKHSK